jgi:hypothetical protein
VRDSKKDILYRIYNLYDMYEGYVWRHSDTKLDILINDNTIGFYLYNDNESIDELIITFSGRENRLYRYISVNMLLIMLRDMVVYNTDGEFYNNGYKPYLRLIVNDEKILEIMKELVDRQYSEFISDKTDIVQNISKSVSYTLFYPYKFINCLDERISLSKILLRAGDRK